MGDITATASQVAAVKPHDAEIHDFIAAEAITAGAPVYLNTNGKVANADGDAGGKTIPLGIALATVGTGQVVSVIKRGHVSGYDLSGLGYGDAVYLSATTGSTTSASGCATIGHVQPMPDKALTKALYVSGASGIW